MIIPRKRPLVRSTGGQVASGTDAYSLLTKPHRQPGCQRLGRGYAHGNRPAAVFPGTGDGRVVPDGPDKGGDFVDQLVDFAAGAGDRHVAHAVAGRHSSRNVGSNVRSIAPLQRAIIDPSLPVSFTV